MLHAFSINSDSNTQKDVELQTFCVFPIKIRQQSKTHDFHFFFFFEEHAIPFLPFTEACGLDVLGLTGASDGLFL